MEVPPTSRFSLNNDTNDTNDLNSPSPRSSSSNGSDKYLIEEISEYDEDDFHINLRRLMLGDCPPDPLILRVFNMRKIWRYLPFPALSDSTRAVSQSLLK